MTDGLMRLSWNEFNDEAFFYDPMGETGTRVYVICYDGEMPREVRR